MKSDVETMPETRIGGRVPTFLGWARIPDELRNDSWGRWAWWVQLVSMAVSAAALVVVLVGANDGLRLGLIALPVVTLSIAWSWLSVVAWGQLDHHRWMGIGFALVDLALLVALILIDGVFGLAIFFVYWRMFTIVRIPWSIGLAALISVCIYLAFDRLVMQMPSGPVVGILILSLISSTALSLFIGSIIAESQSRRSLLVQLQSTREQLALQEREAGIVAERQRLAGELHDTLAQDFASIVMHLEAAGALAQRDSPVITHLEAAKQTARAGLAESRRIVRALRPEMLQGRSLPAALEALCVRWSGEAGIPCRFTQSGDEATLPREVDVTLYRGLQEALTNVRKHARATGVVATLSYLGDEVILDVHDDGIGFDLAHANDAQMEDSIGLLTMRERAEALEGTAAIESGIGKGTTVTMQIPVSPRGSGEE